MKIEQRCWSKEAGWNSEAKLCPKKDATLVLVFGATETMENEALIGSILQDYRGAWFQGASTAGEIFGPQVSEGKLTVCVMQFERTLVQGAMVRLRDYPDSALAGEGLVRQLPQYMVGEGGVEMSLRHVFVLSDGTNVNGSSLVSGLCRGLPSGVTVTGGLAGDGARFAKTYVMGGGRPESGIVSAVGLYSNALQVGFASMGGWDSFGPERLITRSEANLLYELDGVSALSVYKQYLGGHAAELPASGLLFPLSVRVPGSDDRVVRTILGIDEKTDCMIFAGDMPEGSYARLMKANFDRLIDGAVGAAKLVHAANGSESPEIALLISCVGRKIVLRQRVEEETEGVGEVLGTGVPIAGFYSYGEMSPFLQGAKCELHNQTMTITTLAEK